MHTYTGTPSDIHTLKWNMKYNGMEGRMEILARVYNLELTLLLLYYIQLSVHKVMFFFCLSILNLCEQYKPVVLYLLVTIPSESHIIYLHSDSYQYPNMK